MRQQIGGLGQREGVIEPLTGPNLLYADIYFLSGIRFL
jgi:hypothetical protein